MKLKQKENDSLVAPYSRSYGRTLISTIVESGDGGVHAVSLAAPTCQKVKSALDVSQQTLY